MSKRFLRRLVEEGYVSGWDDPRMPTLAGMRRRGYTSAAVRDFIDRVGVSKADSVVDVRLLEYCVRNDLNETAPRAMAVLDPVKVVLTNYEEGKTEDCVIENHPKKPEMGTHTIPLTREIYIEREDFMVDAPKKFFRLKPDGEVRLKGAYIIKCERYDVDENGNVTCIYCSVDFTSKSGSEGADRKVKGTIHWVSAEQNVPFEGRLYDVLMRDDEPEAAPAEGEEDGEEENAAPAKDFIARLNPDSLKVIHGFAEPYLAEAKVGDDFQFLRMGYFCKDKDSTDALSVFNRVVPLKDSYKPEKPRNFFLSHFLPLSFQNSPWIASQSMKWKFEKTQFSGGVWGKAPTFPRDKKEEILCLMKFVQRFGAQPDGLYASRQSAHGACIPICSPKSTAASSSSASRIPTRSARCPAQSI